MERGRGCPVQKLRLSLCRSTANQLMLYYHEPPNFVTNHRFLGIHQKFDNTNEPFSISKNKQCGPRQVRDGEVVKRTINSLHATIKFEDEMNDHGREIKRCLCYIPQKDSTATSRNQQTEQRATNNDRHNYQLARVV